MARCLLICLFVTAPCAAQIKVDAEAVDACVAKGVKFLREAQNADGGWEEAKGAGLMRGGWTCLSLLALAQAGEARGDPVIQRGLAFLRKLEPTSVYVRALQTMAFAEIGAAEDKERIAGNAAWLLKARLIKDGKLHGWSYTIRPTVTDNSNSHYAVLGLWAPHQADGAVEAEVWESIRDYYLRIQNVDGSWGYLATDKGRASSLTMTSAGLCGLSLAVRALGGKFGDEEQAARNRALRWLEDRFKAEVTGSTFYHLHSLSWASRTAALNKHGDWQRAGRAWLVDITTAMPKGPGVCAPADDAERQKPKTRRKRCSSSTGKMRQVSFRVPQRRERNARNVGRRTGARPASLNRQSAG